MKKRTGYLAAVCLIVVLALAAYYIHLPDYRVYKVFSQSGLNYRETDMYVIVYKPWHIEKKVNGIVSQQNNMNGTPNKLTIWLYYSKRDVDRGREFYEATFEYDEDQVSGPPGVW